MANNIKRMKVRLVCKHDTEANWNAAVNFKPLAGELIIYDEDNTHSTPRFKVGDGNTLVNNLPFYPSGDVTVAGNNIFTGNNSFKTSTSFENDIIFSKTPIVTNDILGIGKNGIRAVGRMNTEVQTIKFPDFSNFGITTHTIPLNDTDNIFTGTNTFKTETSDNLYRTLINQDGVSVGGGPGSIVLDITYGFDNIKRLYGDTTYTYTFPNKNGIFATMNDIPNVAPLAKLAQDNTFTGSNTFNNGGFKVNSSYGVEALSIDPLNSAGTMHTGMTTLKSGIDQYCSIQLGAGSVSISSKGTNNNTGHIDISTGVNGVDFNIAGVTSALKVLSDGIKVNSKTKYCGGKIENIVSDITYSLTLPSKSGTLALTSDIDVTAAGNNSFTGMTNTFTNQVNLQGLVRIGSGNSITNLSSNSTTLINVNLPSKAGTLALTDDIPIKSATLNGTTLSITLS